MGEVSTIGLDIAKSVFQIHGVDVAGVVVIRKRISRAKLLEFFATLPACLVGHRGVSDRTLLEPPASGARTHCEAWCRDNIRPGAKRGSAGSQSRAIDICAGCSSPVRWLSSDMLASAGRSDRGSLV